MIREQYWQRFKDSIYHIYFVYLFFVDNRLRDFDILLHDKPIIPNTGSNDHTHRVCHRHNGTLTATQLSVTCTHGEDYLSRYVLIILRPRAPDALILCEVEVYPGPKSGKYTTGSFNILALQGQWCICF